MEELGGPESDTDESDEDEELAQSRSLIEEPHSSDDELEE